MTTSRRLLVAVAALLAMAVLAPAVPAGAIGVLPAPQPGGGTSGGVTGGGSGSFRCANDAGVDSIGRVWYDKYPGCWGYRHTGSFSWCPTGFEVWRFYGTVANPIQSYTTSKVNLDAHECTGGKDMFRVVPHPDDGPDAVWAGTGPWRTSQSAELNNDWLPVSRTSFQGATHYTTNVPFAKAGAGCTAVQAVNTRLRSYQAGGSAYGSALGPAVRQWMKARYDTTVNAYGRGWANVLFDVRSVQPDGSLVQGDARACSSAFDFQAQIPDGADVRTHPNSRVVGMCAVTTQRWSEQFTGAYGYWWQGRRLIVENGTFNGGRDIYVGWNSTQANPALSTSQLRNARDQYRSTVRHEVTYRAPTVQYANHGTTPPGSLTNSTGPYDRGAAALYASQAAYCYADYAGAWYANESPSVGTGELPGTGVEVNVSTPEVGQVGGLMRAPALFSGTPGRVLCNNANRTPCTTTAAGPRVQSISGSLNLTPPPSADWRVRPGGSNLAGFVAPNTFTLPSTGARSWPLDFFAATDGDERYQVTASGTAVIEGTVNTNSGMRMCWGAVFAAVGFTGCETIGGTGSGTVTREVPIVPVYNSGTPREGQNTFPVIGATATPIEDRQG